ncbi:MAG TPA: hypothetical protein P5119_11805 [Candidatus Aminicenantes bacterium]|nr:hypothetical protein [Candidatus Aminicenantes bacterium]HRY66007.1 hypothetical protein [Candidatus Aminicenantes bacterium]HRZ72944.1 hypothetical protein [Candidatus Aminicenantes bacterium]
MKALKILSRIGVGLLVVAAAALLVRAVLNYSEGRKLAGALADLKAGGVPISAGDLALPCSEEDNGARQWRAAESLLDLTNDERALLSRVFLDLVSGKPPAERDRARIEAVVARSQKPLGLIHEMAAKPCFLYRDPGSPLSEALIPSAVMMVTATRLLGFEALGRAEAGDVPGALDAIRSDLRFAAQIASEGTLMAQLIAVADTRMLAGFLEAVCRDRFVDDQSLLRVIGDLEPEAWRGRQARAIRGECTLFIETGLKGLSGARADLPAFWGNLSPLQRFGVWLIRPLLKWDMRTTLPRFPEAEAQARRPYYETRASLRERERMIAERPWYAYFSKLLLGNLDAAFMKEAQLEATLLAARTGLACRLYKSRTGSYPESLGALVPDLLKEVPIDPFTGQPFVYRREGEGFIVYSLGSNQKDDGGRSTYMITQLVMEKDDDVSWRETR